MGKTGANTSADSAATTRRRDPQQVGVALESWLGTRLGPDRRLDALHVERPDGHGYSNDTLLVDAVVDGIDLRWVVQVAPAEAGLFPEYAIGRMARVQADLRDRSAVPVADVVWSEPDPGVLGAPFYVMGRVGGRVPDESPMPYHAAGWVAAATADERSQLWASMLGALGALQAVDAEAGFDYLTEGLWGMPLDADPAAQRVQQWRAYTEWAADDGPPLAALVDAWDHLERTVPAGPERLGVNWGDAKLGNIMFDGFDVAALLDWELVGISAAEEDVTNLLVVDTVLAAFAGVPRAEGFGSIDATVAAYEENIERELVGVRWWYAFGATKMAAECDRILRRYQRMGTIPTGTDLAPLNIAVPHIAPALEAI
jgi:aminoglycoside phosphotransferase (APT) family kinase protein